MLTVYPPDVERKKQGDTVTAAVTNKVCNKKYTNNVPCSTAWEENPSQNKEDKIIKQGQFAQIKDTPAAVNDRGVQTCHIPKSDEVSLPENRVLHAEKSDDFQLIMNVGYNGLPDQVDTPFQNKSFPTPENLALISRIPGVMDTTSNQNIQSKKGIYDSQTSLPSEGYEQEGISLRLDDNPNSIVGLKYNIPFSPTDSKEETNLTTSFSPVAGGGNTTSMDGAGDDISSSPTGSATDIPTHSNPVYNCRIDVNPVPFIDQNHHSDLRLTPEDEKFISKVPNINRQLPIEEII